VKRLDLNTVDLSGTHLVEASAGTGKTYAIASLFIRLLVEAGLPVESILVITFTVPATDELKIRIRNKIREACEAFAAGDSPDAFLKGFIERSPERLQATRVLEDALMRFDEASISTIHGFCRRLIADMAFETASPFRMELVPDVFEVVERAACDYYRIHVSSSDLPEFVAYAMGKKVSPAWFMSLAKRPVAGRVIPGAGEPDMQTPLERYRKALDELKAAWGRGRAEIEAILSDVDLIKQSSRLKAENIPGLIRVIDGFLAGGRVSMGVPECITALTYDSLSKAKKSHAVLPKHAVFDACTILEEEGKALEAAFAEKLTSLKAGFLKYLDEHLRRWGEEEGRLHFDELLLRVHRALSQDTGTVLVDAVRSRYRAALIDEFQDTDPIQYEIISRCFEGLPLFFIGDPKQAVYSFRGADVFTYFKASSRVPKEKKHTLLTNYRSDPGLVEAVNALFRGHDSPFLLPGISFEPAVPAQAPLRKDPGEEGEASLEIWVAREGEEYTNVSDAEDAVCRAVALEIGRILSGEGPGISASNIAVLVRTNYQARKVRDVLKDARIPAVLSSDEDVFSTREAQETALVLDAVIEPRNEGIVRCALMTRIFGLTWRDVLALNADTASWERRLESLAAYHDLWLGKGFTLMFRRLIDSEGVRERLLGMERGERALTNVLHVAELLGRAEAEGGLGMRALRKWLALKMDPRAPKPEESQLRLESDDEAVKVMTVHKSKGLEFEVVFCPFAWRTNRPKNDLSCWFHDENGDVVLDLGSKDWDEHRCRESQEMMAEDLRLFYVSVTRAKKRCYVALVDVKNAKKGNVPEASAPHLLLGADGGGGIQEGLRGLVERAKGRIRVVPMPRGAHAFPREGARGAEPVARAFTGIVDRSWRLVSFTALTRGVSSEHVDQARDIDHDPLATQPDMAERKDAFSFPAGAASGVLLHEIFEKIDFAAGAGEIQEMCRQALVSHGFDPGWTDTVSSMVQRVLGADLGGFSLRDVGATNRLSELEFFYPLRLVGWRELGDALEACIGCDLPAGQGLKTPRLVFDPIRGFVRGFMDLVFSHGGKFYLVDWKSNRLGENPSVYSPASLQEAMLRNNYVLQYLLYLVGLDLYLASRVPGYRYETHFGGVFYVFLRGVNPGWGAGSGIYYARPSTAALGRIRAALVGGPGTGGPLP